MVFSRKAFLALIVATAVATTSNNSGVYGYRSGIRGLSSSTSTTTNTINEVNDNNQQQLDRRVIAEVKVNCSLQIRSVNDCAELGTSQKKRRCADCIYALSTSPLTTSATGCRFKCGLVAESKCDAQIADTLNCINERTPIIRDDFASQFRVREDNGSLPFESGDPVIECVPPPCPPTVAPITIEPITIATIPPTPPTTPDDEYILFELFGDILYAPTNSPTDSPSSGPSLSLVPSGAPIRVPEKNRKGNKKKKRRKRLVMVTN
jgi:hypothetical protein